MFMGFGIVADSQGFTILDSKLIDAVSPHLKEEFFGVFIFSLQHELLVLPCSVCRFT